MTKRTRDWAEATPWYVTLESRMTERHGASSLRVPFVLYVRVPTWPEEQVVHAWERIQPREWAKRRFSRRPFQKFRRRHTDSPASSYELASSAQSSFRFFRMEWPAFDPRTAKGCLICWTGRQAFGPRCCCRACSYENWDRGNSRKQYLVRGKENRSSLAQEYLLLFIYSVIREKKKEKYCSRSV